MREIGSEFWDIPTCNIANGLFDNVTWFISGRAALRAVLQQASFEHPLMSKRIAVPSYLCESIILALESEGFSCSFYDVNYSNGRLNINYGNAENCDYILAMDYFGYGSADPKMPKGKITIRDVTHSLFSQVYNDAEYYFGSLRKWAGFLGGGFAYKKDGVIVNPIRDCDEYINLRRKAMIEKRIFIENRDGDKVTYLNLFHQAEEMLDKCDIGFCPKSDIESATLLDIESTIRKKRCENASFLIEIFRDYCLFRHVESTDCPLCVPILVPDRDSLRRYLISKEIYCPIHWPKPRQVENDFSDTLYENELSLVCDQRYDIVDMERVASEVNCFLERHQNA